MGHNRSKHNDAAECLLDIIPDEVLIVIFSFLSIMDRLVLMRVCKRFNTLLSTRPQCWMHLKFFQEIDSDGNIDTYKRMSKVRNSKKSAKHTRRPSEIEYHARLCPLKLNLLKWRTKSMKLFLKKYPKSAVKFISLPYVDEDLIEYLGENCTQLKSLSFLSDENLATAAKLQSHLVMITPQLWNNPFQEIWSDDLQNEGLWVTIYDIVSYTYPRLVRSSYSDRLTQLLKTCSSLHHLTLCDFHLTQDVVNAISKMTNLTRLGLICARLQKDIIHPHLSLPGWPSLKHSGDDDVVDPLDMTVMFKLNNLRSFSLSMLLYPGVHQLNHDFFRNIGEWKSLKHLSLNGLRQNSESAETMKTMCIGIPQLEEFEFVHEALPQFTEYIALYLKNLKSLTLLCVDTGDDEKPDIKTLSGHLSLETLCLRLSQNDLNYSLEVYDTLLSIPKLSHVKLLSDGIKGEGRLQVVEERLRAKNIQIQHEQHVGFDAFKTTWYSYGKTSGI